MVSESRIKTNHCLMKAFDLNDFLDPNKLTHDELQYYNNLTRALDKTIDKYVDWLGTSDAQKVFYENDKYAEEFFNSIDLELDEIINDTSLSVDKIVEKIYNKGLNQGYKDIRRRFHFSDACKYGLKATQEYNFELITNVSNDLRDTIKHHIFRGVAEGQSIHEVARSITNSGLEPLHGKSMSAYQRASLIAHTEIARSMTTGRLQAYANYGVEKVKILTAEDGKVCPICLEAAYVFNNKNKVFGEHLGERVYSIQDASDLIPFHPGCRCTVIAHIEHYQDIPLKPIEDLNIISCVPAQNKSNIYNDDFNLSAQEEYERLSNLEYAEFSNYEGDIEKFTIDCIETEHYFLIDGLNNEECYKYTFRDEYGKEVLSIYKSKKLSEKSVLTIFEMYQKLPKLLTNNVNRIILSDQVLRENKTETAGYVVRAVPWEVNILNTTNPQDLEYILIHEIGHSFNYSNGNLSKSEGYKNAHKDDVNKSMKEKNNHDITNEIHYISDHSCRKTNEARMKGYHDVYDEDFSECIYYLFSNQEKLHRKCRSIEEYLCGIFDIPIFE